MFCNVFIENVPASPRCKDRLQFTLDITISSPIELRLCRNLQGDLDTCLLRNSAICVKMKQTANYYNANPAHFLFANEAFASYLINLMESYIVIIELSN